MSDPIVVPAFNPSPMTGEGNNTYLLIGEDGNAALIDAGVGEPRHLAAIDRALRARAARLESVLVTHAHPDHISGVPALATAHPLTRFRKFPWPPTDARIDVEWHPLVDGEIIDAGGYRLSVLHTPGHAPDHIALWDPRSRTAFTGDLVVQGSSVMIAASQGGDLKQYLAALERIKSLEAARLLPAHGPEIHDPERVLNSYLEHRREREAQVLAALSQGRATVPEIAESIYHDLPSAMLRAAHDTVRAHLEKLRQDGQAVDDHDRWHLR